MDKYWEENMKSYSNCSNAGEINIDLPNLFWYKLCLSPSNDNEKPGKMACFPRFLININNLKDYGYFAEENKQYDSSDSQHYDTQPNDLQVGVNSKKEDSSHLFIKLTLLRYKSSIRASRIK